MVRGVAHHFSAQQFVVADIGVLLQLLGPAGPAAAQHDFPFIGKESAGCTGPTNGPDEHHVVVEVRKRSAKPSMRHSMVSIASELKVGSNCSWAATKSHRDRQRGYRAARPCSDRSLMELIVWYQPDGTDPRCVVTDRPGGRGGSRHCPRSVAPCLPPAQAHHCRQDRPDIGTGWRRCMGSRPSTQATTASMASSASSGLGRSTRRDLCETTNPSRSENDGGRGPSPERPRPTHDATPPREVEQFVESPPGGTVRPPRHAQSSTRSSRSGVIL